MTEPRSGPLPELEQLRAVVKAARMCCDAYWRSYTPIPGSTYVETPMVAHFKLLRRRLEELDAAKQQEPKT